MEVNPLRARTGFSLIEVVTAVAVIAVIAAVIMTNDSPETPNDRLRYETAADALYNLAQAIAGSERTNAPSSFKAVVGVYPGRLSHLTTQITTSGTNICGGPYTGPIGTAGTNLFKWSKAANPFYGSQLLTAGTTIAPGFTVQDVLVRGSAVATAGLNVNRANTLAIVMPSVTLRDAKGLDLRVDGYLGGTTGVVRYASTDPTSVSYVVAISVSSTQC